MFGFLVTNEEMRMSPEIASVSQHVVSQGP